MFYLFTIMSSEKIKPKNLTKPTAEVRCTCKLNDLWSILASQNFRKPINILNEEKKVKVYLYSLDFIFNQSL